MKKEYTKEDMISFACFCNIDTFVNADKLTQEDLKQEIAAQLEKMGIPVLTAIGIIKLKERQIKDCTERFEVWGNLNKMQKK